MHMLVTRIAEKHLQKHFQFQAYGKTHARQDQDLSHAKGISHVFETKKLQQNHGRSLEKDKFFQNA